MGAMVQLSLARLRWSQLPGPSFGSAACERDRFLGRISGPFPPAVTSRPLLSGLTAAIGCDPGLSCGVKSARRADQDAVCCWTGPVGEQDDEVGRSETNDLQPHNNQSDWLLWPDWPSKLPVLCNSLYLL